MRNSNTKSQHFLQIFIPPRNILLFFSDKISNFAAKFKVLKGIVTITTHSLMIVSKSSSRIFVNI